jgi:phosphofructokinase-like protein
MKTLGILTGGGDCPGLNAVIRAVAKTALTQHGYRVIGFRDGFEGLIHDRTVELDYEAVSGILTAGGTILGTSNKANPYEYWRKDETGKGYKTDESETVISTYRRHNLDALVCIGGDGTLTIAHGLVQRGLNIVGVPKTIDNDIHGTDQTFGFDTAVNIIAEAVDRIQTTAIAHKRVMVVEVMGRNAGWLALYGGVAGGADIILIPEIPYDLDAIIERVKFRGGFESSFTVIVVAEGAKPKGGGQVVDRTVEGSHDPIRLGGIGKVLCGQIEDATGHESRVTVLGHIQRGGTTSPADRILCTQLGHKAMQLVAEGKFGLMACIQHGQLSSMSLDAPAGKQRTVPADHPLIAAARAVGTHFGVNA